MARIKYYYNNETCEFEKAEFNWKRLIKTILSYGIVAILFTGCFVLVRFYLYNNSKEKALLTQINDLQENHDKVDQGLKELEVDINNLEKKDKEVYLSLMGIDSMPEAYEDDSSNQTLEGTALNDESVQDIEETLESIRQQTMDQAKLLAMLKQNAIKPQEMPSILPIQGNLISGFGDRKHPLLGIKRPHTGIDFTADEGTEVLATADGKVSFAGVDKDGYGIHVILNHENGFQTNYAHLSKYSVRLYQTVKRGDVIGYSGKTGLCKGPHLHYEVLHNGNAIDPIDYFFAELPPDAYYELKKVADQYNESMD